MAIVGVAIGSAGLLISLSIVHGFKSAIEEKILGFGTHVSIETYGGMPIYRADTLQSWLSDAPYIDKIEPVIYGQGMIQSSNGVEGTFIKGVGDDGDLSDLRNYMVSGEYSLDYYEDGVPGIIIGSRLARNLNAVPNTSLFLFTIRGSSVSSNLPEIQHFRVRGIYQTGIDQFDDVMVIIPIKHARNLFGIVEPAATQLDIRVTDIEHIRPLDEWLGENLDFPYVNISIYTRYNNIFAWVNLQKQTIPLVIGVMIIVAAFNLIGTILMMVLERIRDIGILKMLGSADNQIRNIFLFEGLFVGFCGLAIGISLAIMFNWAQATYGIIPLSEENYYMSTAPVQPRLTDFIWVSLITMVLCTLASWIPSRVAARLNPLEVTRFGK